MLTSKILKNVSKGYPLKIEATKVEVKSVDYQPDFVVRMMKKVEYPALYEAAQTVRGLFSNI
jgi:multifunctional methyltransferase subunit TRM112